MNPTHPVCLPFPSITYRNQHFFCFSDFQDGQRPMMSMMSGPVPPVIFSREQLRDPELMAMWAAVRLVSALPMAPGGSNSSSSSCLINQHFNCEAFQAMYVVIYSATSCSIPLVVVRNLPVPLIGLLFLQWHTVKKIKNAVTFKLWESTLGPNSI